MMHDHGKSDRFHSTCEGDERGRPGEAKEALEGRELAKGKSPERNMFRKRVPGQSCPRCWSGYIEETMGVVRVTTCTFSVTSVLSPKARAGCGNSACPDPCGGSPARAIPTATG